MSEEQKRFKYFRFSDGIYREDAAPYHLMERNVASMCGIAARIDEVDGFADGITRWIAKDPEGRTFLSWTEEEMEERLASVKQSNNIEELCDEFVRCEFNHCCIVGDIEAKEMATADYGTIYGAIWDSMGLIYVAKMNEKGELELLY